MAKSVIINQVTYASVPEVKIPQVGGGTAVFRDTSGADVSASDVRAGKKAYGANGEILGNLEEIAATTTNLTSKTQVVTIAAGIHSGSGKVQLTITGHKAGESYDVLWGHTTIDLSLNGSKENVLAIGTRIIPGKDGSVEINQNGATPLEVELHTLKDDGLSGHNARVINEASAGQMNGLDRTAYQVTLKLNPSSDASFSGDIGFGMGQNAEGAAMPSRGYISLVKSGAALQSVGNARLLDLTVNGKVQVYSPTSGFDYMRLVKRGAGTLLLNGAYAPTNEVIVTEGAIKLGKCSLFGAKTKLRLNGGTFAGAADTTNTVGRLSIAASSSVALDAGTSLCLPEPAEWAAGATLSLGAKVVFGEAKAGHLRLKLTRTDTANAAAVTLVAGKNYGGADPATWRNVTALGSFASGEAEIVVDTPFLPADTNYLRAFTADGEWSETVFIPETGFVSRGRGLMLILR